MSYLAGVKKATPMAPVITIVGSPGAGKSTLAGLFDSPVFIQAEPSSAVFETWEEEGQPSLLPELPAPNLKREVRPREVLLAQLRELVTEEHPFKTVVLDSITTLNELLEAEVIAFDPNGATNIGEAAGGFGKGGLVVAGMHAKIRSACEHLRKKGITVVFLAHSGIIKMKNRPDVATEYTAFSINMPEKSRHIYVSTSDAVLYVKSKEIVIGHEENRKGQTTKFGRVKSTGERVIITSSDGTIGFIDAKNRYGMPDQIDLPHGENPIKQYIPYLQGESK